MLVLTSASAFADDKPAADDKAEAKQEKPKAEAAPAVEAKQVLEVIEAFGAVANVFAGAVGGEAVPVDPLEQQFLQQFRNLAKSELNFVRVVCQPNVEQSKKIKAASDVGLKTAVKKFAEIQKKLQQGIRAGEQPQWPDPRKLMADVLLKSVKETLSADQAKRYEEELAKRAAARKRVALLNLIAKLDKDLVLTADQRGKLSEALTANWKDAWCQQLETFMYGDTYLPVLPDAQVLPVLTDRQKQIWNALPKQQNQIWGWAGGGFVQAMEVEDAAVEPAVQADVQIKVEEKKEE
ncbi:MAG: hypothetical protein ACKV2Q_26360 [Planctomycetaceae bacterium]